MAEVEKRTKAAYDGVSKYMGWTPAQSTKEAALMANTLITAFSMALKGVGIDPEQPAKYYNQEGKLVTTGKRGVLHSGGDVGPDGTTGKDGLRSDETNRTLQVGEYVVRKEAVRKYGSSTFDDLNKMRANPKMHTGGPVNHAHGANRVGSGIGMIGIRQAQAQTFEAMKENFNSVIIPNRIAQIHGGQGPFPSASKGLGTSWGGVDIAGATPQAKAAMGRAMSDFTNLVGMCLQEVRGWYGIGAKYGSAAEAWGGAKTKHRDSNPKLGAPVFWTGGSKGYGHIAMYMGGGKVRSTDRPTGKISNVPMSSFGGALNYAGWSEDLNGRAISLRKGASIKKDNVLANLHARETVLTADLSASLKRGINGLSDVPAIMGGGNSGGGTTINEGERNVSMVIYGAPGQDVNTLADIIAQREARAEARLGNR
jgi:hypothetical protein